jgi:hypothetical protein
MQDVYQNWKTQCFVSSTPDVALFFKRLEGKKLPL